MVIVVIVIAVLAVIALVVFLVLWNWKPVGGTSAMAIGSPPLPVESPNNIVIQFLNSTSEALLLAAAGPEIPDMPLPREGTWTMPPGGILTLDIPKEWEGTAGRQVLGPRFWARSGCRYNVADNKAQCEIGSCGDLYNCYSGAQGGITGKPPVTLAEFCFACGGGLTHYDVSLVDGYSLSCDILPIGGTGNPSNPYQNVTGLCNPGMDLRSRCPSDFQLKSSQLGSHIPGSPDNIIACLSNCGRYEYPTAPPANCDETKDLKCKGWRKYCCQERGAGDIYGKTCTCVTGCKYGAACWDKKDGRSPTCECRAYALNPPCPANICTNQEPVAQPVIGRCSATGDVPCIGDDTLHSICPRAYSWPNDPQTYVTDARVFRITFSPGGTTVPVSPSSPVIPMCTALPESFNYGKNSQLCANAKGKYAGAKAGIWDCNVDGTRATNGVICQWPLTTV